MRNKAGVEAALGTFPRERVNPNGGSVALGCEECLKIGSPWIHVGGNGGRAS